MKPLPDLTNDAAMLLRGRRSALAAARNESMIELRDAYTSLDGCEWSDSTTRLARVKAAAIRLDAVLILWDGVHRDSLTGQGILSNANNPAEP